MFNPWLILGFVLALLAAAAGGYSKGHGDAADQCAIAAAQKDKEVADLKIKNLEDVRAAEARFNAFNAKVESDNAEKQKRIDGLRIANGRLVSAAGGLFDKNGRPTGSDGVPGAATASGGAASASAGCRLSDSLTEFLLDFARDADRAAIYGQAGHQYAVGVGAP